MRKKRNSRNPSPKRRGSAQGLEKPQPPAQRAPPLPPLSLPRQAEGLGGICPPVCTANHPKGPVQPSQEGAQNALPSACRRRGAFWMALPERKGRIRGSKHRWRRPRGSSPGPVLLTLVFPGGGEGDLDSQPRDSPAEGQPARGQEADLLVKHFR